MKRISTSGNMKTLEVADYDSILTWSYQLASKWVQEQLVPQGIISSRKFDAYKQKGKYLPTNFPRIPDEYFQRKGTWKGWIDFFGNPQQPKRSHFLPYQQAMTVARKAKIKNSTEYRKWKERPSNLPARPEISYEEWEDWPKFLGENYEKPDPIRNTKLKLSDVRIIKHQLQLGVPGAVLARMFNVSEMQISRIRSGENWSYI
jgi:hypothetical protein